jgi:DNA helicase HerA-like ATPase
LQGLAEGFSDQGVPVFCADVKSDLSGLAEPGEPKSWIEARAKEIGYKVEYRAYPVIFWDLFGKEGHPIRTTVAEMGPLLLSRLMDLSEAQEGVLNIAFKIAEDEKLPLLDLKDLQALLEDLAARASELTTKYGNITKASVGSIQRSLLVLEQQGGANFFGEPVLDIDDLMRTTRDGRGYINILAAQTLMNSPRLYATFLLFLLSELFKEMPEVGDPDKPSLVFFFDEAHLLFKDAPKALLQKVEQVVRLIRSKGVGVYFVSQEPADVPDDILGQLGNRVQHALRAFTADDRRELKRAAETYRDNPRFDIATAISEVGTGEAVTSFLVEKGAPGMAERTLIRPPSSRLGIGLKDARSLRELDAFLELHDDALQERGQGEDGEHLADLQENVAGHNEAPAGAGHKRACTREGARHQAEQYWRAGSTKTPLVQNRMKGVISPMGGLRRTPSPCRQSQR